MVEDRPRRTHQTAALADSRRRKTDMARRRHRRESGRQYVPSASALDHHSCARGRRLSQQPLFQDHHRGHQSRLGSNCRQGIGYRSRIYGRVQSTMAHRAAHRRYFPHHAKDHPRCRGRQHQVLHSQVLSC